LIYYVTFHSLNSLKFEDDNDCLLVNKQEPTSFYNDDKELPVFSTSTAMYPAEKLAHYLLSPNMSTVCHVQPLDYQKMQHS
jgi:hypothetical protein